MGLSTQLRDVSNDSIPILLVASAAAGLSYLHSLLSCLLLRWGPHPPPPASALTVDACPSPASAFAFSGVGEAGPPPECVVCLSGLREGEWVRRLPCSHVFHGECLDGWLGQMKLSCPLCRSPLLPPAVE